MTPFYSVRSDDSDTRISSNPNYRKDPPPTRIVISSSATGRKVVGFPTEPVRDFHKSTISVDSYKTAFSTFSLPNSTTTTLDSYHTAISTFDHYKVRIISDTREAANIVQGDQTIYNGRVVDHRNNYNNTTRTTTVDSYNTKTSSSNRIVNALSFFKSRVTAVYNIYPRAPQHELLSTTFNLPKNIKIDPGRPWHLYSTPPGSRWLTADSTSMPISSFQTVQLQMTRVAPHLSRFEQIPLLSALAAEPVDRTGNGDGIASDPDQKTTETSPGDNEQSDTIVDEEDELSTDSEASSSTDQDPIRGDSSIVESKNERPPLRARL